METHTGITVLLVDDQRIVVEAVRRLLADENDITLHFELDPHKAIERAVEVRADVILQDLILPGVDGLDLVRDYRGDERTVNLPLVVLSSREEPMSKAAAFARGANDYLVKLPSGPELVARVRYHARVLRAQRERDAAFAELVATQQRLIASEKMAALGVFTAGMAHEINNPANFISVSVQNSAVQLKKFRAFIDDLLDAEADPDIVKEFDTHFLKLETLNETALYGVSRIEHVVKSLRASNPEGEPEMLPANLMETLEDAWYIVEPLLSLPVAIKWEIQSRPLVECLVAEINQVFIALLTNAGHALEDAAANRDGIFKPTITITSREQDDGLIVSVTDNGIGIPEDIREKIFDPFFTTKTVGRGSGLGLSMTRDVLQKHQGSIAVESALGQGSTFTLRLPGIVRDQA